MKGSKHKSHNQISEKFCPAKINLFLAITGFSEEERLHTLVNFMVPLKFGDTLSVKCPELPMENDILECNNSDVPINSDKNLALIALEIYRKHFDIKQKMFVSIDKQIPIAGGLGGGSSNAISAIKAANDIFSNRESMDFSLQRDDFLSMAKKIGSDCPFFVDSKPAIFEGMGGLVQSIDSTVFKPLKGRRILLFNVEGLFIKSKWAYEQIRKKQNYRSPKEAQILLQKCLNSLQDENPFILNDFQNLVFEKYLILQVISKDLLENFGLKTFLSGSGSTCFCFLAKNHSFDEIDKFIRNNCGQNTFVKETFIDW